MSNRKPILCLDFDGVLHQYNSPWQGADVIPDGPVPGAMAFLEEAIASFKVAIYSSRSNEPAGVAAMRSWLEDAIREYLADEHGLGGTDRREVVDEWMAAIIWPTAKPAAFVTIDDRAVQFTGSWPSIAELLAFKPWNKREPADVDAQLARLAEPDKMISAAELVAMSQAERIAALRQEVADLPNPRRSLLTTNERALIELCHQLVAELPKIEPSFDAQLAAFVKGVDALEGVSTKNLRPDQKRRIERLRRIADAVRV